MFNIKVIFKITNYPENQIRIIIRSHFTHLKKTTIKKKANIGKDVEKLNNLATINSNAK